MNVWFKFSLSFLSICIVFGSIIFLNSLNLPGDDQAVSSEVGIPITVSVQSEVLKNENNEESNTPIVIKVRQNG